MDVVEHNDEWAPTRERLQELAHPIKAFLGACSGSGFGHAHDLDDPLRDELGFGFVLDELYESSSVLFDSCRVVEPGHIFDRFQQGPECDSFPVRKAPPVCNESSFGNVFEELLDEPRFSDPRGPEDREELAGVVADGLLEGIGQAPPLAISAHHG